MAKNLYWYLLWLWQKPHSNSIGLQSMPKSKYFSSVRNQIRDLYSDFLSNSGWLESLSSLQPVKNGKPIPWFTYSAIWFIESFNLRNANYVEVGGGFSTLYFASKGVTGKSYEFDPQWAGCIKESLKVLMLEKNMQIISEPSKKLKCFNDSQLVKSLTPRLSNMLFEQMLNENSSQEESLDAFLNFGAALDFLKDDLEVADIIVIDGNFRNLISALAATVCKNDSIIILDNSERSEYSLGRKILGEFGWNEIPFVGLGPMNSYEWKTSFWLKEIPKVMKKYN